MSSPTTSPHPDENDRHRGDGPPLPATPSGDIPGAKQRPTPAQVRAWCAENPTASNVDAARQFGLPIGVVTNWSGRTLAAGLGAPAPAEPEGVPIDLDDLLRASADTRPEEPHRPHVGAHGGPWEDPPDDGRWEAPPGDGGREDPPGKGPGAERGDDVRAPSDELNDAVTALIADRDPAVRAPIVARITASAFLRDLAAERREDESAGIEGLERLRAAAGGLARHATTIESELKKLRKEGERAAKQAARQRRAHRGASPASPRQEERREIHISPDMTGVIDEAERALLGMGPAANLFQRGNVLVHVMTDPARRLLPGIKRPVGAPLAAPMGEARLRELCGRAARWLKTVKEDGAPVPIHALPPEWAIKGLLGRPSWHLLPLEGIIESPTIRADWSLLEAPGYDRDTGLLNASRMRVDVPVRPTRDQAVAALRVLEEPFADFPFFDDPQRMAAVAAVLTVLCRHAIDGCAPLFLVTANSPKVGKGLLLDVVALIGTGRPFARMAATENEVELEKRITSVAIGGLPLVVIDNVVGDLGGPSLDAVLTAPIWIGRMLGLSRMVQCVMWTVWMATGNDVRPVGDLMKRIIPIEMVTSLDRPELRDDFVIKEPLRAWVMRNRARLVSAALTLMRGYATAGFPRATLPTFGGFEAWSDAIRQPIVWAGGADPFDGVEALLTRGARESDATLELRRAWWELYGATPVLLAEVARHIEHPDGAQLRDALEAVAFRGKTLDTTLLGNYLRRFKDKDVDGYHWVRGDVSHGARRWSLVPNPEKPATRR